jgi:ankyrin repeat protein/Flp pilus assembly protein TadD
MFRLTQTILLVGIVATLVGARSSRAISCSDLVCTLDSSEVDLSDEALHERVRQEIFGGPKAELIAKKHGARSLQLVRTNRRTITLVPSSQPLAVTNGLAPRTDARKDALNSLANLLGTALGGVFALLWIAGFCYAAYGLSKTNQSLHWLWTFLFCLPLAIMTVYRSYVGLRQQAEDTALKERKRVEAETAELERRRREEEERPHRIAAQEEARRQRLAREQDPPLIPPQPQPPPLPKAPDASSVDADPNARVLDQAGQIDDLVKACEEGRLDYVSAALEGGLDINARNRYSWTPLGAAAFNARLEVAKFLLSRGAQVNNKGAAGGTALFDAASRGALDIAVLLIEAGADVNARDTDGHVPLNSALTNRKSDAHMQIIELLLARGARTDVRDKSGWTPLHQAARNNNVRGAKLLLQSGADVNARTNDRRTPLHLHQDEERGDEGREMEELLVAAGGVAPGYHATVLREKAEGQYRLGKHNEAIRFLDQSLTLDPENADLWYNKGCALDECGRTSEAIACYDRVIQLDPRSADALNRKGVALGRLGKLDEQLVCFEAAFAADSTNTKALSNLAGALHNKGEMRRALECYDLLLAIEPKNAIGWRNKATVVAKLGGDIEALECYDRAVELDPNLEDETDDPGELFWRRLHGR